MITISIEQQRDIAARQTDRQTAEDFIRAFHEAHPRAGSLEARLARVRAEIQQTGTYRQLPAELAYGARIALRDSGWCGSGVPWWATRVRDLRNVQAASAVATQCFEHLRLAVDHGDVTPMITVFAPDTPTGPGPRIWNHQLVGYAGYADGDGRVLGDPRRVAFTNAARRLGWHPPVGRTRFDQLPLIVATAQEGPRVFSLPRDVVAEIPLEHPDFPWFVELGLRWYAVPVVSDMRLRIGGIEYPAAPFNTWFIGGTVGTRDLGAQDAYAMALPVALRMGLDTSTTSSGWWEWACAELDRAVVHSFDAAGIRLFEQDAEAAQRMAWLRAWHRPGDRLACYVRGR
ncbi:nitric oxide synthase oxygenase [Actinoalloteichus hymeniacidonis]|uniref:Nitric oxide synthase, oxygenase domain n=1 Tax=Actinoalloteichus hymeniacidonis TaxID=340345 RepID=A0AAC9HVZ5_9PSEU|nr:nitric oxide synthase oxygenase [Actinoalloteichus hymeniacidonis]AOS66021.1 nitric oxide synthase, oxygenase domain [Actinoalloteichus hymeniacidonis]MBB5905877.1 nitric-oxide synthase [Actinoalloteichus hymeniacidonis]